MRTPPYVPQKAPENRHAQRRLAEEVTELVHGGASLGHSRPPETVPADAALPFCVLHTRSALTPFCAVRIRASVEGVSRAQLATRILYERDISTARADDVVTALRGNPVLHHHDASEVLDVPLTKLAASFGIAASNSTCSVRTKWWNAPLTDPPLVTNHLPFAPGRR